MSHLRLLASNTIWKTSIDLKAVKVNRTRQTIRYRTAATLRRAHIKQYRASNEVGATKPTRTSYNLDKVWSNSWHSNKNLKLLFFLSFSPVESQHPYIAIGEAPQYLTAWSGKRLWIRTPELLCSMMSYIMTKSRSFKMLA